MSWAAAKAASEVSENLGTPPSDGEDDDQTVNLGDLGRI